MAELKNTIVDDTAAVTLPVGTTAQRPGSPAAGYLRYNSSTNTAEFYNGSGWRLMPDIDRAGLVFNMDIAEPSCYSGSGTTVTDIQGNVSGTMTNGPTYSSSNGGYISFDGSNDYITFGSNTSYNTPNGATYEVYVYPTAAGEFVTRGTSDSGTYPDNPRLYVGSTGSLYWDWSTPGSDKYMDSNLSCTMSAWNHVVATATPGGTLDLYVNGRIASGTKYNMPMPSTLPNTNDPLIIGGANWIPRYFAGRIGCVRIYNRVLSLNNIIDNYSIFKRRYGL